jgi:hypothetical protein
LVCPFVCFYLQKRAYFPPSPSWRPLRVHDKQSAIYLLLFCKNTQDQWTPF